MSTATLTHEPLWTVEQTCTYLGVSDTTIYRLVSRGDLDARRIGRQLRFDPNTVRTYSGPQPTVVRAGGGFADRLRDLDPYAA